jgi:DNA-binding PadR family transcriptional regulator
MSGRVRLTPTFFHLLLSLTDRPRHGYALMQEIEERTQGRLSLGPGSLYYALGRLEDAGLIRASAGAGGGGAETGADATAEPAPHEERRRYYELTAEGRRRLRQEMHVMADIVAHARATRLIP